MDQAVQAAFDPAGLTAAFVVTYKGRIIAERYGPGITASTRLPSWSMGKSLTAIYLVKKAVQARGEEYLTYPQRHLFDKLGIRNFTLETDPHGNFLLQGYELGTGRDWTRLALLYLNGGVANGERILSREFVDFVRTPAPAWSAPIYGGFFWLNRTKTFPIPEDAYYMAGAGGQSSIIIPTHDMTVVRLGHYKAADAGDVALRRALALLMEAVPQVRPTWQPPPSSR